MGFPPGPELRPYRKNLRVKFLNRMLMFLNKTASASLYSLYFWCARLTTLVRVTEIFLDFRLLRSSKGQEKPLTPSATANHFDILDLRLNMFYRRVQVVREYFLVHVSHSTLQHQTNLQRHFTSFVCSIVLCFRLHELQSDLHLLMETSSPLHDLPSKPSEPAVLFRTQ